MSASKRVHGDDLARVADAATAQDSDSIQALSVSAAMAQAKVALEQCVVTLVGEVSELSNKPGYKAVYFTVKDDKASLPCMMWMNRFHAAGVPLDVGTLVELTGRFTLYAAKGRMNFDVFSLKIAGEGRLRMQVAELARRLQAEGLMDAQRKRPIPKYPECIGLVTSPRGAAVHDVLRTLRRRYPLARVMLAGVPVEGKNAPRMLCEGLNAVAKNGVEVVLLVRGGGSFEDLMPFNDEMLARTIAACPVPVVTGIGHEPDTSIADMVADVRASTPTAAAEAVSPKQGNLRIGFRNAGTRMAAAMERGIADCQGRLQMLAARPMLSDPNHLLAQDSQAVDALGDRLQRAIPQNVQRDAGTLMRWEASLRAASSSIGRKERDFVEGAELRLRHSGEAIMEGRNHQLAMAAARLNDLSPLAILSRGYAIALDDDRSVVKSVGDVVEGDRISVRVNDGEIPCVVCAQDDTRG